MRYIYISASGCSQSQEGYNRILSSIEGKYQKTSNPFEADVIVYSFCILSKECLKTVATAMEFLKIVKSINQESKLIVGGCAAEVIDFIKLYPIVDCTFTRLNMVDQILNFLGELEKTESIPVKVVNRHAIVRISIGCHRHCSFCKCGYMDMTLHSAPMEQVLTYVHHAVKNGARYITLMSENSTEYGIDLYKKPRLLDLLKQILSAEKSIRGIMLTGLCMDEITPDLVDFISKESRIHRIQLEIQSLIPEVRAAMNLHATVEDVVAVLKKLSHKVIITNIMVGHPGETPENFKKQMGIIKSLDLFYPTINVLDNTPGTKTYTMQQVPENIASRHFRELHKTIEGLRRNKANRLLNPSKALGLVSSIRAYVVEVTNKHILLSAIDFPAYIKVLNPRYKVMFYDIVRVKLVELLDPIWGNEQTMLFLGELL